MKKYLFLHLKIYLYKFNPEAKPHSVTVLHEAELMKFSKSVRSWHILRAYLCIFMHNFFLKNFTQMDRKLQREIHRKRFQETAATLQRLKPKYRSKPNLSKHAIVRYTHHKMRSICLPQVSDLSLLKQALESPPESSDLFEMSALLRERLSAPIGQESDPLNLMDPEALNLHRMLLQLQGSYLFKNIVIESHMFDLPTMLWKHDQPDGMKEYCCSEYIQEAAAFEGLHPSDFATCKSFGKELLVDSRGKVI